MNKRRRDSRNFHLSWEGARPQAFHTLRYEDPHLSYLRLAGIGGLSKREDRIPCVLFSTLGWGSQRQLPKDAGSPWGELGVSEEER